MTIREEVLVRHARARLLRALDALPDEAFDWLVFAAARRVRKASAAAIWPENLCGFTLASRDALCEVRAAADAYLLDDYTLTPITH